MTNFEEYEKKIQHIYTLWKECHDPQSKRILQMQGKLLRMAQNKCDKPEPYPKQEPPKDVEKDLNNDEVYDVAKMIFG